MKKYNIEITADELNIVLTALQKLPWEVVNDTIRHIVKQAEEIDGQRSKEQ
jgi:hypothetical protein